MQTKCMLSTGLNRHPQEDLLFAQAPSTSVAVVSFCQGSTLEKMALWKHRQGGSLTPFSSTPLSAQTYFSYAYA